MSAPTCLPTVDWSRLIPPYLHLILGTVNGEVQAFYRELLVLDKIDSASFERMEQWTADVADSEDELIDRAEKVISLLTSSDAFVSENFGPAPSFGRIVEQQPLTVARRARALDLAHGAVKLSEHKRKRGIVLRRRNRITAARGCAFPTHLYILLKVLFFAPRFGAAGEVKGN